MQVIRKGRMIELAEDDPRVAIIDLLLFGPPLPEPEPLPVEPPAPLLTNWQRFWKDLHPRARKWLERLSHGPVPVKQAAKLMGLRSTGMLGLHQHIAAVARRTKVPFVVVGKGRAPKRRWTLVEGAAQQVAGSVEEAAKASSRTGS